MEPQVKAAFLCDYALTAQDGKLSVLGIFGNINFPSLPNAYPRFFVVVILTLDAGTFPVHLGIVDPAGQQLLAEPPAVEVQSELPGMDANLLIDFNGLPFHRAGIHQVQLFVEGRLIHSMPLNVQAMGIPGETGRPN